MSLLNARLRKRGLLHNSNTIAPLTRTRYVFTFASQLQQITTKFLDWGSVLYRRVQQFNQSFQPRFVVKCLREGCLRVLGVYGYFIEK